MRIAVWGGGAFGTALAVALARSGPGVGLWLRDPAAVRQIRARGESHRLPGVTLPEGVSVTADAGAALAPIVLLAVPMQEIAALLDRYRQLLDGRVLVSCAKGIDRRRLRGASALIAAACPQAVPGVLTGPSFAADIGRGLPTALTLALADPVRAAEVQKALATPVLRLYRSADIIGAELGGALKNVIAIAAGTVIGAGLGDSARAALMTRGFAEMTRFATHLGARAETLAGLSGLGDLVLTCTSAQSRNFRFGQVLGRGEAFEEAITVEGLATAQAAVAWAGSLGLELPVAAMVAGLTLGRISLAEAVEQLMARPLKPE